MKACLGWLCVLLFIGSFIGYMAAAFAGYNTLGIILGISTLILAAATPLIVIDFPQRK